MQHSTSSYRSNKLTSQHKRAHHAPPPPNIMQQQQIEELQQKVDMILMHNNKLIEENIQLRQLLDAANAREIAADLRSTSIDSSQIYRLRRDLQLKTLQLQEITELNIAEKHSIKQQLDDLNQVIKRLSQQNNLLLLQRDQISLKLNKSEQEKQKQITIIKQQLQNALYEKSLKKDIEHKEQLREKQQQFNRKFEQKQQEWQDQKAHMEEQKMNTIIGMQEKMQKQKEEIKKAVQENFKKLINKIETEANENCRKVRDQCEDYIKQIIRNQKQQQEDLNEQLQRQIKSLRQSLDQRQKIIQNLLKSPPKSHQTNNSYYDQVQQLRQRIKELTQSFFKQSELLKIKIATKHDIDIRQMVRVYDNKIQFLSQRIAMLEEDNTRLRTKYEDEIRSKMNQRQRFQIQVSKLKNYIRKMKIELESYGKQMRLNIEGIKDQANSFSMSILGQLGQQKTKKLFYEEENRKMRQLVNLKEQQMDELVKQSTQKLKYMQQKLKAAKGHIQNLQQELESKEEKFREQLDYQKVSSKDELRKQRKFWDDEKQELVKQAMDLRVLISKLQQELKNSQNEKNNALKDIQKLTNQLQQCKSHIDALKLEMEMLGDQKHDEQKNILKEHYERIIQQMHHDKEMLKETNTAQSQQLSKVVAKYQILEKTLEKTLSSIKKKTQLETRVMQLGMDNNLVKNLAQIFRKEEIRQA